MLAVITVLGAVSIIQLQGTRSPAIAATNGDSDVEIREGVHYQLIDPPIDASLARVAGDSAGDRADNAASETITVTEFFWYGCPHCQYFEPLVEEWKSTFTDDLELEQIPVVWNDLTQLHASIYYLGREAESEFASYQGESVSGKQADASGPGQQYAYANRRLSLDDTQRKRNQ